MTGSEIKRFGTRLLPSIIEMVPADKPNQKTIIRYKSIEFDKPLADRFFTTENMKRLK